MSWLRENLSGLITRALDSYTLSYDKENVDISLLKGNVHIRNIELKPLKLWESGIPFEAVTSKIGHVSVGIPWSLIGESSIRVEVDDVRIVLAACYDCVKMTSSDDAVKRRRQEKKLRDVLDKEIQLLGVAKSSGFFRKTGIKLGLSLLSSLTRNLNVTINNLCLEVFMPFDHAYSVALCFQVRFGKLELSYNTATQGKHGSSDSVMSNLLNNDFNVSISALEVNTEIYRFNPMHFGDRVVEQAALYKLKPEVSSSPILHKTHITVVSKVDCQTFVGTSIDVNGSAEVFPGVQANGPMLPTSLVEVKARVDMGEVQITSSLEQVMSISRCLDSLKWGLVMLHGRISRPQARLQIDPRRRFKRFRSKEDSDINKSWWKYATSCVIWSIREKWGKDIVSNISTLFSRMRDRERYMTFYSTQLTSGTSSLSNDDMDQFLNLHSNFSVEELVLFRAVTRKRLKQTAEAASIRLAYDQGYELASKGLYARILSLLRRPAKPNEEAKDPSALGSSPSAQRSFRSLSSDVLMESKSRFRSLSSVADDGLAKAIQQTSTKFSVAVDVCIPRFSAALVSSPEARSLETIVMFVSQVVLIGWRNSIRSEMSAQFLLGSVRLYGSLGDVIISCGDCSEVPSDFQRANLNRLVQFASSPSFSSFGLTAVYDSFFTATSNSTDSKMMKHSVFECVFQPILLRWDDSTVRKLLLLREKLLEMTGLREDGSFEFVSNAAKKHFEPASEEFQFSSDELVSLRRSVAELSLAELECEAEKRSLNIVLQDVRIELPCIQGLVAVLEISGVHAISGDYVPPFFSEFKFEAERISSLVENLSNPSVRPIVVSIQCFEARIDVDIGKHKTLPTEIRLTRNPAQFSIVLSRCLVPSHPFFPHLRIDVIGSKLSLSVSPVALFSCISAFYAIKSSLSLAKVVYERDLQKKREIPRVAVLSPLCQLFCKMSIAEFDLEISDDENGITVAGDIRETFLSSLLEILLLIESHGKLSLAAGHCFDVARQRFSSIHEIDSQKASSLFQDCLDDCVGLSSLDFDKATAFANQALEAVLKSALVGISTENANIACPTKILSMALSTVSADYRSLTYDTSCFFSVEKISVFDIDRLPILTAVNSSDIKVKVRKDTEESIVDAETFFMKKLQDEAFDALDSLTNSSAISIMFVSHDQNHTCGQGGSLPSVLHDPTLCTILASQRRREDKFVVRVGQISLLVSPVGLDCLLQSLFSERQAIGDELNRQRQSQAGNAMESSDMKNSNTSNSGSLLTVSIAMDACEISLFCDGCYLLNFQLQSMDVEYYCGSKREVLDLSVKNMLCYDLTAAGTRQSRTLWGTRDEREDDDSSDDGKSLILCMDFSDDKMTNVDVKLHGVRVCFLNRLVSELECFWADRLKATFVAFGILKSDSDNTTKECCWSISMKDLCLLLPRSSFSDDYLAFKLESCLIINDKVAKSWTVEGIRDMEASSQPTGSNLTWRPMKFDLPRGFNAMSGLERTETIGTDSASEDFVSARNSDDEIFYDALGECGEASNSFIAPAWNYERIHLTIKTASVFCSMRHDVDKSLRRQEKLKRKLDWIRSARDEIDSYLQNSSESISDHEVKVVSPLIEAVEECYPKAYARVAHGEKVFLNCYYESSDTTAETVADIWQEITLEKFDLAVSFDSAGEKKRILLDFGSVGIKKDNKVRLRLTCEELNLLQSAWFSNWKEPNFFTSFELGGEVREEKEEDFSDSWPIYGNPEFVAKVMEIKPSFELAVVCPIIELQGHFEIGKNVPKIESWKYVSLESYFSFPRKIFPLLHAQVETLVVHVASDCGLMLVGIEANRIDIDDLRSCTPHLLNRVLHAALGTNSVSTPVASTNIEGSIFFGLDMASGSIINQPTSKPLSVSVIMPPNDWICVNVGVDHPDLIMASLDFVWCLVDFFSCYYIDVRFGHPKLALPPGRQTGVDTRIWVRKPHAAVLASTDSSGATALVMEEDIGVYYRWRRDATLSVRQELRLFDSVLMLHRSYSGSSEARGVRGMSGSGKGLRTILDGISGGMVFETVSPEKVTLLQFCIPLAESKLDSATSIALLIKKHGFDVPLFVSELPVYSQVSCVQKPLFLEVDNEDNTSCDIVSSIEDVLFVSESLYNFLGWNDCNQSPSIHETGHVGSVLPNCQRLDIDDLQANAIDFLNNPDGGEVFDNTKELKEQFVLVANVSSVKATMVDPILGMHLPIAKLFISKACFLTESAKNDVRFKKQICLSATAYGDYFNNSIKCWEPLLEPLCVQCQMSETVEGCSGISIRALTPLHMNLSTAFIRTLSDTVKLFAPLTAKKEVAPDNQSMKSSQYVHDNAVNRSKLNSRQKPVGTLELFRQAESENESENWTSLTSKLSGMSPRAQSINNSAHKRQEMSQSPIALRLMSQSSDIPEYSSKQFSFRKKQKSFSSASLRLTTPVSKYSGEVAPYMSLSRKTGKLNSSTVGFDIDGSQTRGIFKHIFPVSLAADSRVGFSLCNLTGLSLRYTQYRPIKGKYCVEYVENGQRCLLSFLATHSVLRDFQPKEVPFVSIHDFRHGHPDFFVGSSGSLISQDASSGHKLGVQVAGFKWHWIVAADTLGCRFDSLRCILGRRSVHLMGDWKIQNCMQLVTEVSRYKGGRLITFRSPFMIQNRCDHDLDILSRPCMDDNASRFEASYGVGRLDNSAAVKIGSGETYYVPLLLLTKSVENTLSGLGPKAQPGIGNLWVKPAQSSVYLRELSNMMSVRPFSVSVSYPRMPIPLFDLITETANIFSKMFLDEGNDKDFVDCPSTVCTSSSIGTDQHSISRSADDRKSVIGDLPPFCYIVEVRRTRILPSKSARQARDNIRKRWINMNNRDDIQTQSFHDPVSYSLSIHPPIIIENLLVETGYFELINVNKDMSLWGQHIKPGQSVHVHTVGLDVPLRLMISLSYCRSLAGAIIHNGEEDVRQRAFADSDNVEISQIDIILTDSIGQKLRAVIENTRGGAGQRRIVVFCPYWILNSSQFSLRFRQEGGSDFPAGTVSRHGNGALELSKSAGEMQKCDVDGVSKINRVFPGHAGLMDCEEFVKSKYSNDGGVESLLSDEIPAEILLSCAFMFNFADTMASVKGISNLLSSHKMTIQVQESDWSEAISLDTVGMDLNLSVCHASKGNLELGYKISSAVGRWASYTRILRFWPRYVLWNKCFSSVRMFQTHLSNSSLDEDEKTKLPIVQVSPSKFKPFHLPDLDPTGRICFQISGGWKRSTMFNIDIIKDYTFKTMCAYDYRVDAGLGNRSSSEFEVTVPANCPELGVWFETDWSHEWVIVKSVQNGAYASRFTDVAVGDLLLEINSESVEFKSFDSVIGILKRSLGSQKETVLRFLTVEERLRRIRVKAVGSGSTVDSKNSMQFGDSDVSVTSQSRAKPDAEDVIATPPAHAKLEKLDKSFFSDKTDHEASFDMHYTPSMASSSKPYSISRMGRLSSFDFLSSDNIPPVPKSTSAFRLEDKLVESKTRLSVRSVGASILLTLSAADDSSSEYRIENNSVDRCAYVRQDECYHYPWTIIPPSSKVVYTWENPTIGEKVLCVSMGYPVTLPAFSAIGIEESYADGIIGQLAMISIPESKYDETCTRIPFDEIGFESTISFPQIGEIGCRIGSDGPAKVLVIGHNPIATKQMMVLNNAVCNQLICALEEFEKDLQKCFESQESLPSENSNRSAVGGGSKSTQNILEFMDASLCKKSKAIFGRKISEIFVKPGSKPGHSDLTSLKARGSISKLLVDDASESDDFFENQYSATALSKQALLLTSNLGLSGIAEAPDQYWHPVTYPNISAVNVVIVEVLEARDLRATDISGFSDPYGVVSFRANDKSSFRSFFVSNTTYYCSKTLCPVWSGQRFILVAPNAASLAPSLFWIKIKIKDHDVVGFRETLGDVQVRLSLLLDEKEKIGWFRLSPRNKTQADNTRIGSSLGETLDDDNRGAVKLRMRWIHTFKGLSECRIDELKKKIHDLRQLSFTFSRLSESIPLSEYAPDRSSHQASYPQSARNVFKRAGQGLIRTGDKLAKATAEAAGTLRNQLRRIDSEGKFALDRDLVSDNSIAQAPVVQYQAVRPRHRRNSSSSLVSPYKLPIFSNANPMNEVHVQDKSATSEFHHHRNTSKDLASHDKQKLDYFKNQCLNFFSGDGYHLFTQCFTKENKRAGRQLMAGVGVVRIKPLQADFLPLTTSSIFVKICYGAQVCQTTPIPPSASPDWSAQTLGSSEDADSARVAAERLELSDWEYVVDLLNVAGPFRISVYSNHHLGMYNEISRIEISPFAILDCCVKEENADQSYIRWFPLLDPEDAESHEGDSGLSGSSWSSERLEHLNMERKPCLRLQIEWIERETIATTRASESKGDDEAESQTERSDVQAIGVKAKLMASLLSQTSYWKHFGFQNLLKFTRMTVPGISTTLIDSEKGIDIMHICVSGIEGRFGDTKERLIGMLTITWCQVDNPSPICQTPVILAPILLPLPQPVIRVAVIRNNTLSHSGLICMEKVAILVQSLQLSLEQSSVVDVWDWVGELSVHSKGDSNIMDNNVISNNSVILLSTPVTVSNGETSKSSSMQIDTKLYIDSLSIGPIKVFVSFLTSSLLSSRNASSNKSRDASDSSKSKAASVDISDNPKKFTGRVSNRRHRQWALVQVGYGIGSSLANFGRLIGEVILDLTSSISDAPVKLNSLEIDNLFSTNREVTRILQDHYLGSVLGEIYKIVGSLDLVGNPLGLVSSLGTGVRDFFYEPALGLITSPHAFGQGVVKGTLSLVSNTTSGVVGAATKITRSFGKGAASLSMDKSYLQTRERISKREIGRGRYGDIFRLVPRPVYDLYFGIQHAVTGVFMNPVDGYKSNGLVGLASGTALGIAGLAVKPVVGVLDAATHAGETLGALTKRVGLEWSPGVIFRRRLGSIVGPDGRLMSYAPEVARGQHILQVNEDQFSYPFLAGEGVVIVRRIQASAMEDLLIIVTTKRLVAVKIQKNKKQVLVDWELDIKDLCDRWKGLDETCPISGPSNEPMVPCELIMSTSLQLIINRKAVVQEQVLDGSALMPMMGHASRATMTDSTSAQPRSRFTTEVVSGEFHDMESFSAILNVLCASQHYWDGIVLTSEFSSMSRLEMSSSYFQYGSGSPCFVACKKFVAPIPATVRQPRKEFDQDYMLVKAGRWNFAQQIETEAFTSMLSSEGLDDVSISETSSRGKSKKSKSNNMRILESVEWSDSVSRLSDVDNSKMPQWLMAEEVRAKSFHTKIAEIEKTIAGLDTSDETISTIVVKLLEGQLSDDEFQKFIVSHVECKRKSVVFEDFGSMFEDSGLHEAKLPRSEPSVIDRIITAGRDLEISQTLLESARMVTSAIKERATMPLAGLRREISSHAKSSDDNSSGSFTSEPMTNMQKPESPSGLHSWQTPFLKKPLADSSPTIDQMEKLEARIRQLESRLESRTNNDATMAYDSLMKSSSSVASSITDQADDFTHN